MNAFVLVLLFIGVFFLGSFLGRKRVYHQTAFQFCEAMLEALQEWEDLPPNAKADTGKGVEWLAQKYHEVTTERGLHQP